MRGQLTPRQVEVLELIADGKTGMEISIILGRSIKTIEVHRLNIAMKLNSHNTAQSVMTGLERGWLRLRERYE
jgi:DNA-binding CsgD family transcriptional regulator